MIKKIQLYTALLLSAGSYYSIVVKMHTDLKIWLLSSLATFMILSALAILTKSKFLQIVIIPALLFYSAGTLINVPRTMDYLFAYISAVLMLTIAAGFFTRHLLRLRLIKLTLGTGIGVILLLALNVYKSRAFAPEVIKNAVESEMKLFSSYF